MLFLLLMLNIFLFEFSAMGFTIHCVDCDSNFHEARFAHHLRSGLKFSEDTVKKKLQNLNLNVVCSDCGRRYIYEQESIRT
jgi:hypothetical protein